MKQNYYDNLDEKDVTENKNAAGLKTFFLANLECLNKFIIFLREMILEQTMKRMQNV